MRIFQNFELTNYNAYRLKSFCETAIFPESEEDLIKILNTTPIENIIILGNGNNIILSKEHYDKTFIIFNNCFNQIELNETTVSALSGATLQTLCEVLLENELSGMETFYDIPSSVGGAVVMNAGASGDEIKNVLVKVRYIDIYTKEIIEKSIEDLSFEYRNSFFQKNKNYIILKAWLALIKGNKKEIEQKMLSTKANRWAKQPREYPNCGSVFKRPKGKFVGPMLDELGLKGHQIGGAQVSEKHSGFIINKNNATGEDVLALIADIQKRVKEKFEVDLEVEQRII